MSDHQKYEVYRSPRDVYIPLIDKLPEYFSNKSILDPSAGDARMLKYILEKYPGYKKFHRILDIRFEEKQVWNTQSWIHENYVTREICNFLDADITMKFDTMITNPPFSLAIPFVEKGLKHCEDVFILQRSNWLGTQKRSEWLSKSLLKTVYIIPKRPVWEIDNKTNNVSDTYEYFWFHFSVNKINIKPEIEWLL